MDREPYGKEQPSIEREAKAPSPKIALELKQLSKEMGQERSSVPLERERPLPEIDAVAHDISAVKPSLDEMVAKGLDRRWMSFSERYGDSFTPGDSIHVDVREHSITAQRDEQGITFTVDGQTAGEEFARNFLIVNASAVYAALQKEAEEKERQRLEEEQRNQREVSRREQARFAGATAAAINVEELRRSQAVKEIQEENNRETNRREEAPDR